MGKLLSQQQQWSKWRVTSRSKGEVIIRRRAGLGMKRSRLFIPHRLSPPDRSVNPSYYTPSPPCPHEILQEIVVESGEKATRRQRKIRAVSTFCAIFLMLASFRHVDNHNIKISRYVDNCDFCLQKKLSILCCNYNPSVDCMQWSGAR